MLPFFFRTTVVALALCLFVAAGNSRKKSDTKPTVEEAKAFVDSAEKRLKELWVKSSRASWVQSNFITDDTEALAADAQKEVTAATVDFAKAAARFNGLKLPYDVERKLNLLKLSLSLPAPGNPAEQEERPPPGDRR